MQRIFFQPDYITGVYGAACDLETQKRCKNSMCCAHVFHPYCSLYSLALIMSWTGPTEMVVHSRVSSVLSTSDGGIIRK